MDFARDLLVQAKSIHSARAGERLEGLPRQGARRRGQEGLSAALEKLGVDWTAGPATGRRAAAAADAAVAGGRRQDRGRDDGQGPRRGEERRLDARLSRARRARERQPALRRERDGVRQDRARRVEDATSCRSRCRRRSFTRTDELKATLFSAARRRPRPAPPSCCVNIEGKLRPMFAYSYQTIDDQKGSNHDGLVQRGEQVRTLVTVKNIGAGQGAHTEAVLRNGTGQEGILISAGRFDAKDLAPGETKTFSFVYEVRPELQGRRLPARAGGRRHHAGRIGDRQDQGQDRAARTGARADDRHGDDRARRRAAARDGRRTARWSWAARPRGRRFKVTGKLGAFTRVELDNDRSAFVATADLKSGGTPHGTIKPEWQVTPPILTVTAPTVVDGRHGPHQGPRHRRAPGARRLRARLEPQRQDPGEEGLLSAEPPDRRSHEDGLRGRHPAVDRAATWCRCSRASRTTCSRCRPWSCSSGPGRTWSRSRPTPRRSTPRQPRSSATVLTPEIWRAQTWGHRAARGENCVAAYICPRRKAELGCRVIAHG